VLLLGHPLTALLDHRAHELPLLPHRPAAPESTHLDHRSDQAGSLPAPVPAIEIRPGN
jgi:hypothetical protein